MMLVGLTFCLRKVKDFPDDCFSHWFSLGKTIPQVHLFYGKSEKSGCDYYDSFPFWHSKLNKDSIFKEEVEMDIVKIKCLPKTFNKAKEISSYFFVLSLKHLTDKK